MTVSLDRRPGELRTYLRALAQDATPTQVFDLRYTLSEGRMARRFVSVLQIGQLARQISELAPTRDVYLGAVLRDSPRAGQAAITGSRLLYIESDDPQTAERLAAFPYRPTMVIASGSPGHLHLYWRLAELASPREVEGANRRLAVELGAETACTDVARLLRPPRTLNHKHSPPAPVRLLTHDATAHWALPDILAALPLDPLPRDIKATRLRRPRRDGSSLDRALLEISAAEYVRVLSNREPNRAGKVECPFHQENTPSLQLYPDGTFYCFGASCRNGGTIFDFAAALWGTGTRGEQFRHLRRRLANAFGLSTRSSEARS